MERLNQIVERLNDLLWNFPMLALLLGTHLYFTVRLGFVQKKVPQGIRMSFSREGMKKEGISPYEALSTALAATIGTGNIIGISAAIAIGGPGAVFWCWLSGLLGMATCYAECFLSARYRVRGPDGTAKGGPMYVMEHILHQKGLAILFSFFAVVAALSVGSSVQAHSLAEAVTRQLPVSPHPVGIAAALLAGSILVGGAKKTAKACTCLVPVMSAIYLGGCLYIIVKNVAWLPETLRVIVGSAFSSRPFIGGIAGTAVMTGIRTGMAKGLFTNEAGMGSMPMTAALSNEDSPAKQGLISMTGIFWDTLVMCAVTGLAILSDMVRNPGPYLGAAEDSLCFIAFSRLPFAGQSLLSLCLILFSFATIIGWSFYGERAAEYLWGKKGASLFEIGYMVFVYLGAVLSLDFVWNLSDLANACMAIPNLICLWMLRKKVRA
ncbi:MAG TPA: amino acid carrier protein [Candidatus Eisenbergiella merdigallinarum]|uniref:Amino acid carrier protein n=1 Tax=Candidatus Eisenbergiella merdigallinarum TaxID=2838552 RepID=A0A9D2MQ21_9FIRM|nr:amino acid carrier protein [Candidatus Eisenbergiella merdigallinarum]